MATTNLKSVTIANGQTVSNSIFLDSSETLIGIVLGTFTSATLTFKVTYTRDSSLYSVYSGGSAYSIAAVANSYIVIDPSIFLGARGIQITSSASQGQDTTLILVTAEL